MGIESANVERHGTLEQASRACQAAYNGVSSCHRRGDDVADRVLRRRGWHTG